MADRTVTIGVAGALGRMGRAVAEFARLEPRARLGPLFDRAGSDDPTLVSRAAAFAGSDVIVDFTSAAASSELAEAAAERGGPALVIGSTGLSAAELRRIEGAASRVPIVRSDNFSLGVNLLAGLVRQAAAALGPEAFDIEVFEAHHRAKIDAPSGTALMLGRAAAEGRGEDLAAVSERGRDGLAGPRRPGAIGFSVMRAGGIVGEHTVVFASDEEILTLGHSARDRRLFARGAVLAAVWLRDRPPGLYDMQDVLGFRGAGGG